MAHNPGDEPIVLRAVYEIQAPTVVEHMSGALETAEKETGEKPFTCNVTGWRTGTQCPSVPLVC